MNKDRVILCQVYLNVSLSLSLVLNLSLLNMEQCLQIYPEQAAELDIAGRIRQVRTQQAEKEFTIADFYRRTDKSEAAFYYWREITERFGDTEFAAQARELIEQYQDRAAEEAGHV